MTAVVTKTMLPAPEALGEFHATDRLTETARPTRDWRDELRRIPNLRNTAAIGSCYAQTLGIIFFAVWANHPVVWVLAFLLMGRAHAQFAALMHEAAHRLLFAKKTVNDWVGRWILGYPSFTPTDLYRRGHMAHHREEFGPEEPDIPLYRGYPIQKASLRRKLWRDATGQTGWKLLKGLLRGVRASGPAGTQARRIAGTQVVLIAISIAVGHPWVYWLLWFAPYMTVWRVINRLRSIAEHGGMQRSKDRRNTTHTVRQSWVSGFVLVPFHIGFHLAHHVDSGVPMSRLPRFHNELRRSGYITDAIEYPSYRKLWAKLASG